MKNKGYFIKKVIFFCIFGIFIFSFVGATLQNNKVILYFFYGKGCPHCAQMEPFLDNLKTKYPLLEIKKFEVYFNDSNRDLFQKTANAYGTNIEGVPTVFIGDEFFVGYSNSIAEKLENKVKECINSKCVSPEDKLGKGNYSDNDKLFNESKFGLIVFFVFVFMLVFLVIYGIKLNKKNKKRKK